MFHCSLTAYFIIRIVETFVYTVKKESLMSSSLDCFQRMQGSNFKQIWICWCLEQENKPNTVPNQPEMCVHCDYNERILNQSCNFPVLLCSRCFLGIILILVLTLVTVVLTILSFRVFLPCTFEHFNFQVSLNLKICASRCKSLHLCLCLNYMSIFSATSRTFNSFLVDFKIPSFILICK